MAVKKDQTTKLILKVQTGTNAAGAATYSQRIFAHVNPALSDDDFLAIATALGSLQAHEVGSVNRQDAAAVITA